ncbi:hypothetical protein GGP85_002097 [Salinibacter ruber]|uniref:hypothetical protein n=1 Tax=Salinibacter ruber TaxID=146919 RepID=UPI000E589A20|nr:hypothetical protein [Salinibacter ruber]MCS3628409.1 hypothetical protein [Salinibacter ruber]MCS3666081.1 hypothetical protein [Salinibacter ruber]MCS3826644.1 hypothetical protein [Salinibacter ruber]MCS4145282.1 hypothetical protein [Salinibacter ruber]
MATHSQGTCYYCDADYTRGGMVRHLRACSERKAAIDAAEGALERMYHLRADDEWGQPFWLDLEMRGSAALEELDRYLRTIWLECCGHLSQFSVEGWGGDEIAKSRRVDQVFDEDTEMTHIYDFGTESRTLIRTMDVREGPPTTAHPIELMARNHKPEVVCMNCDRTASWLCVECMHEEDASGTLCDEHAEEHPHDAYGAPMPIVNSPRTGMCGYTGPAEPPY